MVPRTKHIVIGALTLALLLLTAPLFPMAEEGMRSLAFLPPQTALVMNSQESYEVVVSKTTTREDARVSLMERLRTYVAEGNEAAIPSPVPVEAEVSLPPEETVETATTRCGDGEMHIRNNWGPVNVTVAEGARIITSLAIDDAGAPLNVLQLPLAPRIVGDGACLPSDMVGVLLDGTIIMPDTPVVSDAEGLAGYAIDGFPLFGSFEDGETLMSSDLDDCHGHVHTIIDQGVPTSMFHYHITDDAPYALGCLRGASALD